MKKLAVLLLCCATLFLGGCEDDAISQVNSKLLDANGNFSLWVSNQSFAIENVDITVEIDGELVISEYFNVGTQHTFKEFKLALKPGSHRIHIWSNKGDAKLSQEFEFKKKGEIGVLLYWHSEKKGSPIPKKFTFRVQEEPLQIM